MDNKFPSSTQFLFWFDCQNISIDSIIVRKNDFSLGLFHFEKFNNLTLKNSAAMDNFISSIVIDCVLPFENYSTITFENNSFTMNKGGNFKSNLHFNLI